MSRSEKIRPEHLARPAFVYVRQSTVDQVRHHQESRRRQYDLAAHARALGWQEVVVIDEDLGKSGTTTVGRTGFQRLVAEVSLGRAGAVLSLEVSRLARNNRDWHQLLELCGLTDTVIVDADGCYDPRLLNDRLLLGLKGTISEAELGWLRQRAYEGLLAKARRGELRLSLPVGYVHTADGRIEKHPDQRVQAAIRLVFERFATLGSARQVLLWFRQERLPLPALVADTPWGERVTWRLPIYNTILSVLHNPVYAGAYAFGRTATRTHIRDGAAHKTRGHRRPREAWLVLLPDHHAGYIAWETYERHQQLLADNAQMNGLMAQGAARTGPSLAAGLLRCGRCGRRVQVAYSGPVARYTCRNQSAAGCGLAFGGLRVEAALEREVLRVLTPGAIEAACTSAEAVDDETAATRHALELELREARYEADRAQRQYDAVEPEHRLVAGTLEQRWNAALARVAILEQRLTDVATAPPARPHPIARACSRWRRSFPLSGRIPPRMPGRRSDWSASSSKRSSSRRSTHGGSSCSFTGKAANTPGCTSPAIARGSTAAAPTGRWSTSSATSPVACRTRRSRAFSIASATARGPGIRGPNSASSVSATPTTFPSIRRASTAPH